MYLIDRACHPGRSLSILTGFVLAVLAATSCTTDWPAFRHNLLRNAHQPNSSDLSDPSKVSSLHVAWQFSPSGAKAFRASPIVYKGKVYIGNGNGRLYCLKASDGSVLWQYPPAASPALTSQFTCNPSSLGLASSAVIARVGGTDAVIFGAPDKSFGSGLGEGRLFALNAETGAEIWKSGVVARLTGTTSGSTSQFHEQIGYSAPLVFNSRVYIGVANHCDNPIQNGRVVAVELSSGTVVGGFNFEATNTRGGGVWGHVAGWFASGQPKLYVTTGNVKSGNPGGEPAVNHALGMLQLDAATGSVDWKLQPVPFAMDFDPDWASGATVMGTNCGTLSVSTMKDGWTYAVNTETGACLWKFPPVPTAACSFTSADGTVHGDIRYLRAGAAWQDVFVTMTGGVTVVTDAIGGYGRLHALNVCASQANRIRWMLDVPNTGGGSYRLGPPSVTRGVFYVGTGSGHLVAFGDPSIWPAAGWRCSNPNVSNTQCAAQGFTLVPEPAVLADIQLQGSIMTEPVIVGGKLYVASGFFNDAGTLYMLES